MAPFVIFERGADSGRKVALTFEGGPCSTSEAYLEALDRAGCRATFFLSGRACARRPEKVLDIVRRGHAVGWHGESGRPFHLLSARELELELHMARERLPPTPDRWLVRPPRGELDLMSLLLCARAGFSIVLWSVDGADSRASEPGQIARQLGPARVRAGDVLRITEGSRVVLKALPAIVRSLREADYALVTATELLERP